MVVGEVAWGVVEAVRARHLPASDAVCWCRGHKCVSAWYGGRCERDGVGLSQDVEAGLAESSRGACMWGCVGLGGMWGCVLCCAVCVLCAIASRVRACEVVWYPLVCPVWPCWCVAGEMSGHERCVRE